MGQYKYSFWFLFMAFLINACYKDDVHPGRPVNCDWIQAPSIDSLTHPSKDLSNGAIYLSPEEGIMFSLNDTLYQELNLFTGLLEGEYIIFKKDQRGCVSQTGISLNGQPSIEWISPSVGDSVSIPIVIEFQTWNWKNGTEQKEIRLFRNDTLVGVKSNGADTLQILNARPGYSEWRLSLWDGLLNSLVSESRRSFFVSQYLFELLVIGGDGSGIYAPGERVNIKAKNPKLGLEFFNWNGDTAYLDDPFSNQTSLIMPSQELTMESHYGIIDTISYSAQVQPIIQLNCAKSSCHVPGTPNTDLTDFLVVQTWAEEIKSLVSFGTMPPPPDILTQGEIDLIVKWVNQGALNN